MKEFTQAGHVCESDSEWETNSGNGDAPCHNEITGEGIQDLRLTSECLMCPYHEYGYKPGNRHYGDHLAGKGGS